MSKYVFGPVPSRRLGRSLGIDLIPFKTCSYDCIYCQLGRTTCKTIERKVWLPLEDMFLELIEGLSRSPDYITLSGSGEPTLCAQIGETVDRIKTITNVPLAVLTNGSLLWQPEVRRQLQGADLVIPSLDAGSESTFQQVNAPDENITFEKLLDGLITFREEFRGEYWLEVLLVADLTATPTEVERIAACAARIKPDRVQLNTVTRPPADRNAVGVPPERLAELASLFSPPAEVIADFRGVHQTSEFISSRKEVLEMLQRRPCSIDDIADGLHMHQNEVVKYLEELKGEGLLEESFVAEKRLFSIANRFLK